MTIQVIKKISPIHTIAITGLISLLIVFSGTAWVLVLHNKTLEEADQKQTYYLDLLDFREQIVEFDLKRNQTSTLNAPFERSAETQKIAAAKLLFFYQKLLVQMQNAGLKDLPTLHQKSQNSIPVLSGENLELFRLVLERSIEKARIESKNAVKQLVFINQLFLFFIVALILTLGISGGWLLYNKYRHTLIPLRQLAGKLKRLNSEIPESVIDTTDEMKKELTESDHSSDIIQVITSFISICDLIQIKNKKLDEILIRDEKTNLFNYRHLQEHLITEIERAKRYSETVSLVMLDIDNFAQYNEVNGHISADYVLKNLAGIISAQCRISDIPARFGGDEFAILFPKTDSMTVWDIAERLRKIVNDTQFRTESGVLISKLTISIGTATFPLDAHDWNSLISHADKAMNRAKSAGKNKVISFLKHDETVTK
ncbi:MAG: GGDEF domain-containing protein [Chlorobium sp.]